MRLPILLIILSALPSFSLTISGGHELSQRDTTPPASTQQSGQASPTSTEDDAAVKSSTTPASGSDVAKTSSRDGESRSAESTGSAAMSSSRREASSTDPSLGPTATPIVNGSLVQHANTTSPFLKGQLPLKPVITPALATAGAVMMLTGIFYTLIGIKTKWLHVFLSSGYLVSLAVTVLIVYVCHPPITDAIQGAYLVAIVVTGLIFGGGSIVFADVAEGLGCLLGGFALAMWFLVLTPGGLITSTAGKAIFIGCLTIAAFGLYVSHWTRSYGQIGAISFAGATVVVLGIDCFSRAGLKEFWLYIWNLNSNIFPDDYNQPYPITRGIRVETAGIFLLFLLGVMSQMKIWKIIKERRESRAAAHREVRDKQNETEAQLGRMLEEGNGRDKSLWEKAFGHNTRPNAHPIDSGIGTDESGHSRKDSWTVNGESQVDTIELDNIKAPSIMSGRSVGGIGTCPQVTVRVAEEDEVSGLGLDSWEQTRSRPSSAPKAPSANAPSVKASSISAQSMRSTSTTKQQRRQPSPTRSPKPEAVNQAKLHPGPKVPALPFKVSEMEREADNGSEGSSVATFAASDRLPSRLSKRLSGNNLLRRISQHSRKSFNASHSEEALVIPHIDDDRESSVAANVGELDETFSSKDSLTSGQLTSPRAEEQQSHGNASLPGFAEPKPLTLADLPGLSPPKDSSQPDALPTDRSRATPSDQASYVPPTTLRDHLPEAPPKVVSTYRTNEWAKHLDQAEAPAEPLPGSHDTHTSDQPAPVLVKELRQTPFTAEPKPALAGKESSSPRQSKDRSRSSSEQSPLVRKRSDEWRNSKPRLSTRLSSYITAPSRNASQSSLRQPSSPSSPSAMQLSGRATRSSSQPLLNQALLSSPTIEEDVETAYFPPRASPSPAIGGTDTLMSQRHSKVQRRASAISFHEDDRNRLPSATGLVASATNRHSNNMSPLSDPSLSQRKPQSQSQSHTVRQQLYPSAPSRQSSTSPATSHAAYHQHQHQRPDITPRDSLISDWRSSLAADKSKHAQLSEMDHRREQLLREKHASDVEKRRSEAQMRKSSSSTMMMMGNNSHGRVGGGAAGVGGGGGGAARMSAKDLGDRHREAMRRMQGSVRL